MASSFLLSASVMNLNLEERRSRNYHLDEDTITEMDKGEVGNAFG
jgi:hypothetical protein